MDGDGSSKGRRPHVPLAGSFLNMCAKEGFHSIIPAATHNSVAVQPYADQNKSGTISAVLPDTWVVIEYLSLCAKLKAPEIEVLRSTFNFQVNTV